MQKSFRYIPVARIAPASNPIILDDRVAMWAFWSLSALVAGLIVVAIYWLLAHPVT